MDYIYCAGKFIAIHEKDLPSGLLGCTDTNSVVYITSKHTDVPKGKILKHELLHVQLPESSELEIRYLTQTEYDEHKPGNWSIYLDPVYT